MSGFDTFVASVRWQYATTMPDWPHEYTVKDWRPDLETAFVAACELIEATGVQEPWPPPPARAIYHHRYLVVGDHKYWAMGPRGDADLPQNRTVINRARLSSDPDGMSDSAGRTGMSEDWYDFRSDTPEGYDPDSHSPTLRQYHQALWSQQLLPDGRSLELNTTTPDSYLSHDSVLGRFDLASDTAVPTYVKELASISPERSPGDIAEFERLQYTIGGMIAWPGRQIDRQHTINQARGFHPLIKDRLDLTLECVRRHYDHAWSPLQEVLARYASFFTLFEDFTGYVEFWLLQDAVNEQGEVRFLLPFNDFTASGRPRDLDEYRTYMTGAMAFLRARNQRIAQLRIDISREPFPEA